MCTIQYLINVCVWVGSEDEEVCKRIWSCKIRISVLDFGGGNQNLLQVFIQPGFSFQCNALPDIGGFHVFLFVVFFYFKFVVEDYLNDLKPETDL